MNAEAPSRTLIRMLCPDKKGIINWATGIIRNSNGNILDLEQHAEKDSGLFAMRLHVEGLDPEADLKAEFQSDASFPEVQVWIDDAGKRARVAILVTRESGCLYELLIKQRTGELNGDIVLIIGNCPDLEPIAGDFQIPFFHLPIDPADPNAQVEALDALLDTQGVELTVLARYMRILPASFVEKRPGKIINIHHGFLPAFKGARPYHQAWERGVKIIGATAHYVTTRLDEGPILHQETVSVSHRHSIREMIRAGRNLERTVLFEAVRAHLEHRVLLTGRRTIVFHF